MTSQDPRDQFAGTFQTLRADQLKPWDVLFHPARQLLALSHGPGRGQVALETSTGPEIVSAGDPVCVFRPDPNDIQGPPECPACGAEEGEPCDVLTCLGLAALADAQRSIPAPVTGRTRPGRARPTRIPDPPRLPSEGPAPHRWGGLREALARLDAIDPDTDPVGYDHAIDRVIALARALTATPGHFSPGTS